jgi:hypothetical protein
MHPFTLAALAIALVIHRADGKILWLKLCTNNYLGIGVYIDLLYVIFPTLSPWFPLFETTSLYLVYPLHIGLGLLLIGRRLSIWRFFFCFALSRCLPPQFTWITPIYIFLLT